MADRVVDVVVDIGDPVNDAHDLALEGFGLVLAGVSEDAVAHFVREVEALGDAKRLLVVAEAATEARGERGVQRFFAGVPKRRVAHIVTEADRLDEVLVQAQRTRHDAGDSGRLERVGHAGAVVVAGRIDEDLRLAFQPAKRLGMDDPVAVALERRTDPAVLFLADAAACLVRTDGRRRERMLFELANAGCEQVGNSSG